MGIAAKLPTVFVAMEEEQTPFLQLCDQVSDSKQIGGATFTSANLNGQATLLVKTGIGLVNAASAATLAVELFQADFLISAGSAGGMGAEVKVGDVVIGTQSLFSAADATAFGRYQLGQIPRLPPRFTAHFHNDAQSLAEPELVVNSGLVISGDSFVWEKNYGSVLSNFPDALAADMETAAIAQVAHLFGVRWLAVRGISDLCGPADFAAHIDDAARLSAQVTAALLAG